MVRKVPEEGRALITTRSRETNNVKGNRKAKV